MGKWDFFKNIGYHDQDFDGDIDLIDVDIQDREFERINNPHRHSNIDWVEEERREEIEEIYGDYDELDDMLGEYDDLEERKARREQGIDEEDEEFVANTDGERLRRIVERYGEYNPTDDELGFYGDIDEDMELEAGYEEEEPRTIATISFSVAEKEKKPKEGLFRYHDDYSWEYFRAICEQFPELKSDYAGDEDLRIDEFLGEIKEVNIERAIKYWKWVMTTFKPEIIKQKDKSDGSDFDYEAGGRVLFYLIGNEENDEKVIAVLKDSYYFNYIFKDFAWEKHDTIAISNILARVYYIDSFSFCKKCYDAYLEYQQGQYTNRDIAKIWDSFITEFEWKKDGQNCLNYIKSEMQRIGDFGNPVLKRIAKLEQRRREELEYEENERKEEEERQKQEAEWKLAEAKEREERELHVSRVRELEEKVKPLLEKIEKGELFTEPKEADKKVRFCFHLSKKTYDTVIKYLLSQNGTIEDFGENTQIGEIKQGEISTIYMITSISLMLHHVARYKYSEMSITPDEKRIVEFNKPIVELLFEHCPVAKLIDLIAYGRSIGVQYYETDLLKKAYDTYRNYEIEARERAKSIFANITQKGNVKVSWVEEKRLYTYFSLHYDDAIYKFTPQWGEGLSFDIYIPSLKLVVEYQHTYKDGATKVEMEQTRSEIEKLEHKKALCGKNGIQFAEWSDKTAINEVNVLDFMSKIKQ